MWKLLSLFLIANEVTSLLSKIKEAHNAHTISPRTKFSKLHISSSFFSGLQQLFPNVGRMGNKYSEGTKKSVKELTEKIFDVIIIGSGVSGLSCAKELVSNGFNNFTILEADDQCGGRIRTDDVDGFLLDRGFQVFIDSYPLSKQVFDYNQLSLKSFLPGAMVRYKGNYHLVSDPLRLPQDLIPSVLSPIGSILDKLKVGLLSVTIRFDSISKIFSQNELTTQDYLSIQTGLSPSIINQFFKPFFQGIFLSPLELQSSRMFQFIFKMFSEGSATLPSLGMHQIPLQLAASLPIDSLEYNTRIQSIQKDVSKIYPFVVRNDQIRYSAKKVVIAADPMQAQQLMNGYEANNVTNSLWMRLPGARSSTTMYFGLSGPPPVTKPILILNGENDLSSYWDEMDPVKIKSYTTINNICFPSQVSASYAPPGMSLASVTIVGKALLMKNDEEYLISDEVLESSVRSQLQNWWPNCNINDWKLLKIYRIAYAQPGQEVPYDPSLKIQISTKDSSVDSEGMYCCGDHRSTATVNGAIESGVITAKLIMDSLKESR